MENLSQAMKSFDKKRLNKKERIKILKNAIDTIGRQSVLVISMEELSELVEVVSENIDKKVDYLHTLEEVVDVMICSEYLKIIYSIKESKLNKIDKKSKVKKSKIVSAIRLLSKSSQYISKCIRHGKNASDKALDAVNMINEGIWDLKSLFKIKQKDIDKMVSIKMYRLDDRLKSKDIKEFVK